jgi:hypothetical protein
VVDYSATMRIKVKMQSAADAASVAAVSQQSPGYSAALAMTSDGNVSAGASDANNIFNGNFSGFTNLQVNSTVTKTGVTPTSNRHVFHDGADHLLRRDQTSSN